MRALCAPFAIALLLGCAAPAAAFTVGVDFTDFDEIGGDGAFAIVSCGVTAQAAGVVVFPLSGLGVWGGLSNEDVDGGEGVRIVVNDPGTPALRYFVPAASNVDGDGLTGEHFLEGFGPHGDSLGAVSRAGVGWFDATGAFGGASLGAIEITAQADGLRIGRLEYESVGGQFAAYFSALGSDSAPQVDYCGISVTSSTGAVGVLSGEGLYARTFLGDAWIDSGESLQLAFDAPAHVEYAIYDALDDDTDGEAGEHFVEGFDATGASLGIRSADAETDPVDLAGPGFFGDTPLSRIVVSAADRLRIAVVTVPEPAGFPLAAAAAVALLASRRRLH